MSVRRLDGSAVSPEERERRAPVGRTLLGRTIGPWEVLRRVGRRGRDVLWRCRTVCCGEIRERTTNSLQPSRRCGKLCHRCLMAKRSYEAAVRHGRAVARCRWCRRRADPKQPRGECHACRVRAWQRGRDETGRPLGRVQYHRRRKP